MNKKLFFLITIIMSWLNFYLLHCSISFELIQNTYSDKDNMAFLLFLPIFYIVVAIIKVGMNLFLLYAMIFLSKNSRIDFKLVLISKMDAILWKIISAGLCVGIIILMVACYKFLVQNNVIGCIYSISSGFLMILYIIAFSELR
jgi:hypothetical protein